jgi:hypothetical protein
VEESEASAHDFKQDGAIFGAEQQASRRPAFQQGVDIGDGRLDALGGFIIQILDDDLSLMTIQDGKAVASPKYCPRWDCDDCRPNIVAHF